jgi:hypothetical protein
MNVAANPLCRLAPRTRSQSCAHSIPPPFKAALTGLSQPPIEDGPCNCSTIFSTRGDGEGLKEYLLKQETAFNIHNPSLDHRVR